MMKRYHVILFLLTTLLVSSCNVWKHVPEGEKLYTGAQLKLKSENRIDGGKKQLKYELEKVVTPKPNSLILGGRFGLWLYFKSQQKVGKKLLKKLNRRFGEEPVYLSDVNVKRNEDILINRLENNGFFGARVNSAMKEKDRTGSMVYTIQVPHPYFVQTYTYLPDSTAIDSLREVLRDSLIKTGSQFDTELLRKERERIDEHLKDKGYYHFSPDHLTFISDTNHYRGRKFDLYLQVKDQAPENSVKQYRINEITVYTDYSIDRPDSLDGDTSRLEGILFKQGKRKFKPKHLLDYIAFRKGYLYSNRTRITTTRKLSSMGAFQYVSIRYTVDTLSNDSVPLLNASIQLSPYNKRNLQLELQGVTKSNDFAGPALIASFINRNLFRGGEVLEIAASGSYETQIAQGNTRGLNSFQFKVSSSLTFPRIWPVRIRTAGGYSVPKTRLGISGGLISRAQFYNLATVEFDYGFRWNTNDRVSQSVTPINLIYSNVFATTPQFDSILANNSFLAQSFEDQFIPGLMYTFEYSQLNQPERKHRFYLNFSADLAGNIIGGIQSAVDAQKEILGLRYAQYAKASIDLRHYVRIGRESQWVTRLFTGWSIPYGNSTTLPYIKQFFAGGPNSIRAFRARSLGPGGFGADGSGGNFFDQSGDIKLEVNTEFRHPIYNILKGAAFIDAGNVWLTRKNEDVPEGEFDKDWYRHIAIGFGYGFRLDIQFIVIRFDFATPLRYPNTSPTQSWTETVGVWQRAGFGQNVIVNFSIGYPF